MARLREHLPELRARTLTRRAVPVEAATPLSEALRRANEAGARALVVVDGHGDPKAVVREAAIGSVPEHRRPWVAVSALAQDLTDGMKISVELSGRRSWTRSGPARPPSTSSWRRPARSTASCPPPTSNAPSSPPWPAPQPEPLRAGGRSPGKHRYAGHMSEPTGAARRRGPFKVGDQVQLTDPKGRHYTFTLEAGKNFHTHKGSFPHDELIGAPEGSVVRTTGNVAYLALRPLLPDYVLSMPRGAAVVYPKDAGQILAFADIFPGARVVEAGVGSGSLSTFLLRAIGDQGMLHSYERREDFAEIAQQNVERYFGEPHPAWQLTVGDLQDNLSDTDVDRVILDMLAPWECLDAVAKALVPGGILCAYVATTTQLARTVESIREMGCFAEPQPWESMIRNWHVEGLAVRPDHRMIGHTGFLVTARRLADGVEAPLRRRRPAKGAYGEDYDGPGSQSGSSRG